MEMVNKIQEILNTSAGELQTMIQNVEKQINEYANQIQTDIQKNEEIMQAEVQKCIEGNKANAEQIIACATDRNKAANNLREVTAKDLTTAGEKFRGKIGEVGKNMEKSFDKLRKFHEESQRTITKIIENTKDNPIDMTLKLKEQVEPMQKKFTTIREDIAKNLKSSFDKSQTILKELETSVNNIDTKTRKQYNDLTEKFKKCAGVCMSFVH